MQQQHSVVPPDGSPFLLVEGNLVQFALNNGKQPDRVCGWAVFDLDQDMAADSPQFGDTSSAEEALILVNWNDDQRKSRKRFILMLLRWAEGGRAERKDLLSDYRKEYDAEALSLIPRTRKRFVLQYLNELIAVFCLLS